MEIRTIPFEDNLIIIKNNQRIVITPFLNGEYGTVKMGIEAPRGIGVDREEIHKLKKAKLNPKD
jgi:sRNA-binding carbon storage regulator CsrA